MDKLPFELLVHVLSHLPPFDRVDSALVCRRWAEAVCTSTLLEDVRIAIDGRADSQAAGAVVIRSQRKYRNLKISWVKPLVFNAGFWRRIGETLREVEFCECTCSPEAFIEILRVCPLLESLKMKSLEFEPPGESYLTEMQESFGNLRHVELPSWSTSELLAELLRLMPEAASISHTEYGYMMFLLDYRPLEPHREITELCIRGSPGTRWKELMEPLSAGIRILRLCSVDEASEAIGECRNLRVLELDGSTSFSDEQMKKVLLNNPGLEDLELFGLGPALSHEGFAPMFQLKKLRKLNFSSGGSITEEFLWSLGTIPSLQYLNLANVTRAHFIGVRSLRSIASLPDLQTLIVRCDSLTCGGVDVVLENFENLRNLKLLRCDDLKEEDFLKLRNFKRLSTFELSGGREFTDLAVEEGLILTHLESLNLSECSLTNAGLACIGASHSRLRDIKLHQCGKFTEDGLISFLKREPRLEIFGFKNIPVTGKFFRALAKLCPRLRHLQIIPPRDYVMNASDSNDVELFKRTRSAVCVLMETQHQ